MRSVFQGENTPEFRKVTTPRQFRAENRNITVRNKTNKAQANIEAENIDHVRSMESVLQAVLKEHPEIRKDPNRFWNLDETCIDSEFDVKQKVICSSFHGSSGYKSSSGNSGSGVHVTAVVATSASGLMVPPFFIIAGKNYMENWTSVVTDEIGNLLKVTPSELFTRKGWFPDDGVIVCSERGSMTSDLLPVFIRHLNRNIRNVVSEDEHVLVTLDGHSSRKGLAWLREAKQAKMVVVRSPANTTHFLQPWDLRVNKRISKGGSTDE